MSKEKTDNQYLKEIAHFSRKTSNNIQFLFYLLVMGGVIGIMFKVVSTVNQIR